MTPKSKKETFEQLDQDTYKISVKEKAERNLANIRVLELVSEKLAVPKNKIKIITGHHTQNKILFIGD